MQRGRFITFEGGEGAGKSTQLRDLAAFLRDAGLTVVETREPGGSPGAEQIRELLIHGEAERWDAESEALLIFAARRDHLRHLVWPELAKGSWVLCDRFLDSTLAYQGYGRGLPLSVLEGLAGFVIGDFRPDLTLILDLPPELGLARAASRRSGGGRFEALEPEFHERLRRGFLEIAAAEPERCRVIDASLPQEEVAEAVRQAVREHLGVP